MAAEHPPAPAFHVARAFEETFASLAAAEKREDRETDAPRRFLNRQIARRRTRASRPEWPGPQPTFE
jgi:hypothetical protein